MALRGLIRGGVELLGVRAGVTGLARRAAPGRVAIVAYHNVVAAEEAGHGDSSLHMPLPAFLEQVERLARTHTIVDIEALLDGAPSERRPRAAITFDDAYRGAVTLALPELRRRGLPATVFVSPGLLGADSTWWDELAEAGRLTKAARDAALRELAGKGRLVRERLLAGGPPPALPRSYGIASAEELRRHCEAGVRLGSHAWGHEYLPALDGAELRSSLVRSLGWVEAADLPRTRWLALPYGGGSPALARVALDLGYAGVLRIEGGLWDPRRGPEWTPRINVPAGISPAGLELRTSGLLRR